MPLASSGIAALRLRLLLVGEARNPGYLPGELLPRPTPALVSSWNAGEWVAGLRSVGLAERRLTISGLSALGAALPLASARLIEARLV